MLLIFIWISTAVSGTLLPGLNSNIWAEDSPIGIKWPTALDLLRTPSPNPFARLIPTDLPRSSQSSHSQLLHLLGAGPVGTSSPPLPTVLTQVSEYVQPDHLASELTTRGKRKPEHVQMPVTHSDSIPSPTPTTDNGDPSPPAPKRRKKDGVVSPETVVPIDLEGVEFIPGASKELDQQARKKRPYNRPTKRGPYKLKLTKPNQPSPLYFTSRGLIHVSFIKEAFDRFKLRFDKCGYDVTHLRLRSLHPDGMLVTVHESLSRPDTVIRVLRAIRGSGAKSVAQTDLNFKSLYKVLIGWIYEKHEELINFHNLPTFVHRLLQDKLINWLDELIFGSPTLTPMMGKTDRPHFFSWKDHQFTFLQAELIDYFAQEVDNNLLVPTTALRVIQEFRAQHQLDYLISEYPLESSQRISSSPEFQMIRNFITDFLGEQKMLLSLHLVGGRRDSIFQSIFKRFENHFPEIALENFQLKSLHPKLPMAMYFVNKNFNVQPIRVLYKHDRSLVKNYDLLVSFTKLVKTINFFHIKILNFLKIETGESYFRREDLLEWVLQSTIKSTSQGHCVLGLTRINGKLAPWEDIHNGALSLFGQVQLELIEYFSQISPSPDIESSSIFILLLWYKEFHSLEFEHLLKTSTRLNQLQLLHRSEQANPT
ncbi:hypothetical protein PSTT_07117 [Puccinia striiformis]|uniref:Uncharacterized protein n=1 Tax=Puccinia striiformis TaxID=27350 RepID=A0A2S4VHH9_9BASI|nr:hypothetical protein PSTT_07117 [Puccinia striiformis]